MESRRTVADDREIYSKRRMLESDGELTGRRSAEAIQAWLRSQIATLLEIDSGQIDVGVPFASYGLASRDAVTLSGDLETWLGRRLSPTLVFEYPSIESLARFLAEDTAKPASGLPDETNGSGPVEAIAIVGIGCRFPGGASSPAAFWQLLCQGVDAIAEVPPERWDWRAFHDPDPSTPGKMSSRWGGFLPQVEWFDAGFFGISPREAIRMDPQQRLLLEVSWEALEDAGSAPDRLAGTRTGVFIGISSSDYGQRQFSIADLSDAYAGTGSALSIAANRLSYVLGLRGPSLAVDTACSSSLVAVHLACQSLRSGESTLALAGGVNLILSPAITVNFTKAGFMAPDGRCKAFDATADGYVRSEGAGVVVLKPLARALSDGDVVYAVIRGSAVNQDGRTNGLTAPSRQAQEEVLREAYRRANVSPGQIQYVEAHGTGTALGDPIEAKALGVVLAEDRPPSRPALIGSVKTNIGHLEAAAGIAGLIKVALALKYKTIPPSLHFRQPNPFIPFDELPLRVHSTLARWPESDGPALAGVSSFGFGGTNAHVVLEGPPTSLPLIETEPTVSRPHLLPVSARSPAALRALAERYRAWLTEDPPAGGAALRDICYSAGARRAHHAHRLAVLGETTTELAERLAAYLDGTTSPGIAAGRANAGERHRLVFTFAGQGTQYVGMGRELLTREPVFRAAVEECDELFQRLGGWSVVHELADNSAQSRLAETQIAQPAIFALQVGLTRLWRSWGIEPDAVVGHSVGEVTAAYAAGALTLAAAAAVVFHRSRLMHRAAGQGQMAAIELPVRDVDRLLANEADGVSVAAINAPASVVVAGAPDALGKLLVRLGRDRVAARILPINYAFHSPQMAAFEEELVAALAGIAPHASALSIFSTVTGQEIAGEALDATYWARNLREPVRFADAIDALIRRGHDAYLEISPQPVLGRAIRECFAPHARQGVVLASMRRGPAGDATQLGSLAQLYALGFSVDWHRLNPDGGRYVALPTYPFQRERYWLEAPPPPPLRSADTSQSGEGQIGHPLLGRRLQSPAIHGVVFEARLSPSEPAFLADHRVAGTVILPAAAYVELALAAAAEAFGPGPRAVEDLQIDEVLILAEGEATIVQVILSPSESGTTAFQVVSRSDQLPVVWRTHARGITRSLSTQEVDQVPDGLLPELSLEEIRNRCTEDLSADRYYERLRKQGLEYGAGFQGIVRLWRRDGESLGEIRLPDDLTDQASRYRLHPVLLDAGFQLFGAAAPEAETQAASGETYLPVGIERVVAIELPNSPLWCHVRLRPAVAHQDDVTISPGNGALSEVIVGDLRLTDARGATVVRADGIRFRRVKHSLGQLRGGMDPRDWLYQMVWRPETAPPGGPAFTSADLPARPDLEVRASGEAADDPSFRPGRWLIFADRGGTGEALAERLRARGESAALVFADPADNSSTVDRWVVDPARPDALQPALREAIGSENSWRGVVHLWNLDAATGPAMSPSELDAALLVGTGSILHLVQTLVRDSISTPRLWLVSRGAQTVEADRDLPAVTQTPAWGLSRVIALEHPELRCVCLDLDPADPTGSIDDLFSELWVEPGEDQVGYRHRVRYVARLVRCEAEVGSAAEPAPPGSDQAMELVTSARGLLDNLVLRPVARRPPGPGQVEIRVHAAGLNFRDVLSALDMYPGDPGPLGGECAGEVVAIGPGVDTCQIGDEVIALAPGSFRSFVVADARLVVPKPSRLSFQEAATIPITFLTADFALRQCAALRSGERVLIHAAAGGVGLAAVQIAQRIGAEIFGTAGSPQKREFLRARGVGHVSSSRSLDFADEVLTTTAGRGVDVVLNALSGEFIPKSLSTLAHHGRYLEIGKIGIWDEGKISRERPDVSYFVVDLAAMISANPSQVQTMLRALAEDFEDGSLKPLPYREFPIERAADAFRYMAQAKHVGKVVLSMGGAQRERRRAAPPIRADGTYLITGGLGALGLRVARWLTERGARHLILVGRRGVSDLAGDVLGEIRRMGADVVVATADVSRESDLAKVLAQIDRSSTPLRGVVHAAGVLDDGVLLRQDWSRFVQVMAPKVKGAWNLHRLTSTTPLDFFVLFSSGASLLGAPGQGNYAAANAFLDALAPLRQAQGLPGLAINWGPWSDGGMAAGGNGRSPDRPTLDGIGMIPPEQGLRALEIALSRGQPRVAVLPIDWPAFLRRFPAGGEPAFLSELADSQRDRSTSATLATGPSELMRLLTEVPPNRRRQVLTGYLRDQIARVLGLDPSVPVDAQQPLIDLGLDSLMAVELRNAMVAATEHALPATLWFDYPTIESVTAFVLRDVLHLDEPAPSPGSAATSGEDERRATIRSEVRQLSDDEVARQIDEELRKLLG